LSAIGFNRFGDMFLVFMLTEFTLLVFSDGLASSAMLLGLFAATLKSVSTIVNLWLPEAMEGPTPVSSLLHSCTLVMAGLFTVTRFHLVLNPLIFLMFCAGFLLTALFARHDRDLKKVIAASTAVMVALLWVIVMSTLTQVGVIICLIHAAYKSCLFACAGKLIANLEWSSENTITKFVSVSSLLCIPLLVASAIRSSCYTTVKHSMGIVLVDQASFIVQLATGTCFYFIWAMSLKLLGASKPRRANWTFTEFTVTMIIFSVIVMSFIFQCMSCSVDSGSINILAILFCCSMINLVVTPQLGLSGHSSSFDAVETMQHSWVRSLNTFLVSRVQAGSGSPFQLLMALSLILLVV